MITTAGDMRSLVWLVGLLWEARAVPLSNPLATVPERVVLRCLKKQSAYLNSPELKRLSEGKRSPIR